MTKEIKLCPPWEAAHIVERANKLGISPRILWQRIQKDPITRESTRPTPGIPYVIDIENYIPKEEWKRLKTKFSSDCS